jgi:hypothetical protein
MTDRSCQDELNFFNTFQKFLDFLLNRNRESMPKITPFLISTSFPISVRAGRLDDNRPDPAGARTNQKVQAGNVCLCDVENL